MKLVIIESPYAGDIDRNVTYARKAIKDSISRGEAPICSHLLFTQPGILRDDIENERCLGIKAGLAWRRVCNMAIFYIDYGWSPGMQQSLDLYKQEKIPFLSRTILKTTI